MLIAGEVRELPHLGDRRDRAGMHGDDDAEHVRHRLDLEQVVAESLDLEHALLLGSRRGREVLKLVAAKHQMRDASCLYIDQQRCEVGGTIPSPASWLHLIDVAPQLVVIASAEQSEERRDRRSYRKPAD